MKVLFITQEDPIYVAEFWREFVKFKPKLEEAGIEFSGLVSLEVLGESKKINLLKRIYGLYSFVGSLKLGFRYLQTKLLGKNMHCYAKKLGIAYLTVKNLHSESFLRLAREQDLIVPIAASKKFKLSLLTAPKLECINIHSGPLPKYRGMIPVFCQLKSRERKIGITVHKMGEKLDDGEILYQEFVDVSKCKTLDFAIRKIRKYSAEIMCNVLINFEEYASNPIPNDKKKATYFSFPSRKDADELLKRGLKLV